MRKNSIKNTRINGEVQKELSNIIRNEIKDPRIGMMTSVTAAEVAPDLKTCKVYISVFGDDYDTPDGTGVRDYIHVVDLAKGHVAAINKIKENPGVKIYNLGTGKGYSVLDVIHAFGKACGKEIPYEIKPRRAGDIATCYSDASLAKKELGWEAQYDIDEMCADSWKWQSMNPDGYNTPEK